MNHDDERDHAEEAYNAALLHDEGEAVTPAQAILDAWHAAHGIPAGVNYENGVQYFGGEPRFQSLWCPLLWVSDLGVVEMTWEGEDYRYDHDRARGVDIHDDPRESWKVLERILGPSPAGTRKITPEMLRRLADHMEHPLGTPIRPVSVPPVWVAEDFDGGCWHCGHCDSQNLIYEEGVLAQRSLLDDDDLYRQAGYEDPDEHRGEILFIGGADEYGDGDSTPGVVCLACGCIADTSDIPIEWV